MKINEIINKGTADSPQSVVNEIKETCQPYLSELNGGLRAALGNSRLFRGIPGITWATGEYVKHITVNQERPPMDTPQIIHKYADEWFNEKFGIKYRSQSIFCTGAFEVAYAYSKRTDEGVVIVIPVGKFDYCWSPTCPDLYFKLRDAIALHRPSEYHDIVQQTLDSQKFQSNVGLAKAIQNHGEIMIACKQALLVRAEKQALLISKL